MLTDLRIENFAIVSSLELEFQPGMTAFTGETGAGKSIMIDALMLALGGRADASVIRAGTDKCDITACFQVDMNSAPAQWLVEQDIPHDNGELYLRRVVYPEGRSKSYINGHRFPQQKVKELSEMLVDIHGQHQHQRLLHHPTHREQLDRYANHVEQLDLVQQLYRECQQLQEQLALSRCEQSSLELDNQINELEQLTLQEGELDALHQEHQLLNHARDYLKTVQHISELIDCDEQPDVRRGLTQISHLLTTLPIENAHVSSALELIQSTLIQCDEVVNEVSLFSRQVQLNPLRLLEVEERMSELHSTARKYHIDTSKLPEHLASLHQQREDIMRAKLAQSEYQEQYQARLEAYQKAALALRDSRQHHAVKLAAEITASIRKLGMPEGYVQIECKPLDKMHPHGLDKIEYQVCTNPGMPPDTLAKIASGGELSRISLAIQMITAQRGSTPTLLFDEVDVGIGGATAALVGKLLRDLSQRLQVFCVTHQPQVACCAHNHFRVEKQLKQQQTFSNVFRLDNKHQIDEIARMLGGLTITEQTRSNARELLTESQR